MNDLHGKYWTKKFRSEAFVTMRRVCALTDKIKFEEIQKPVLCIYTEKDKLISIPAMQKLFNRIGTDKKRLFNINSPYHVIAGDVVSPETTETIANEIITFIKSYE
jgi:esterase/lipase